MRPDLVFGASAGALNAAWVAGDPKLDRLDELAAVWKSLRTRDVFPLRPIMGLLGFLGRRNALVQAGRAPRRSSDATFASIASSTRRFRSASSRPR